MTGEKEKWRQKEVLQAQAIANVDIYFFSNPDKVALAKDVLAKGETIDNKSSKWSNRRFCKQRPTLCCECGSWRTPKVIGVMGWCHGLVLVAYNYEDHINRFMEKHGDAAMELLFKDEYEAEVATFFRLCIDLRMLNSKTNMDRFPLPRIDDLLESIPNGCGRFSISDIADAFFKCELAQEYRHKTAFKLRRTTSCGSFVSCRRDSSIVHQYFVD